LALQRRGRRHPLLRPLGARVCLASAVRSPLAQGYVITQRYFRTDDLGALTHLAFRRYWRLFVPCAVTSFIAYLFVRFHAYGSVDFVRSVDGPAACFPWPGVPSFGEVVRHMVVDIMLFGAPTYNGVAWTISREYITTLGLVFVLMATHRIRCRRAVLASLTVVLWLWGVPRSEHVDAAVAFLVGAQLSLAAVSRPLRLTERWTARLRPDVLKISTQVLASFGLLLACLFFGYPTIAPPAHSRAYGPLHRLLGPVTETVHHISHTYYTLAAVLFLLSVPRLPRLRRWLETPVPVALGELSLMLYLTHDPLQGVVGAPVFRYLVRARGLAYTPAALLMIALYWPVALAVAWLLTLAVERPNARFMNWLQRFLVVVEPVASSPIGCVRFSASPGVRSPLAGTSPSTSTTRPTHWRRRARRARRSAHAV
jgi:peptidoglycan/LPS O-acetylase OafA/YrhL